MSTLHLFNRAAGLSHPYDVSRATTTRLTYALQPAPSITFSAHLPSKDTPNEYPPAHASGVNAIAIDKFEGRYLLSGGADSSLAIWDLETPSSSTLDGTTHYSPLSTKPKTAQKHNLGITSLTYYPFDSLAFLTASYDHTVKLYNSETLTSSAIFDLHAVVHCISVSPIADHLLVAAGTAAPHVRLIDLRSGASSHSLAGHTGAVLATTWSPTREHILASGASDGSIRLWDVRRANAALGVLDMENSVAAAAAVGTPSNSFLSRPSLSTSHSDFKQARAKSHHGPVNGLLWTPDGYHIISSGHDNRIRVWDTHTGANTLVNFGPLVKSGGLAPNVPVLVPREYLPVEGDVMFFPNQTEILGYEVWEGKLIRRLRRPMSMGSGNTSSTASTGAARGGRGGGGAGQRNVADKITALAWRAHNVEMYSAHSDGTIFAWKPRTEEDAELDEEEEQEREAKEDSRKRKRNALDDIFQDLTTRKITFGGV